MKKLLFIILIGVSIQSSLACDICGCSTGNYFLGPTPQFNNHFIGLRYSFRSFNTVLKADNTQFSNDFYQTTELWGGYRIKPWFQVLAFVPFNSNASVSDDGKRTKSGLGDITLLGNFKVFNNNSWLRDTLSVRQQLWLGGGVKLPSGKFSIDTAEVVSSANSQLGTGSFDFIVMGSYDLQIENWGLTSNVSYKINQSASAYKFGDRFSAGLFAFRTFYSKKMTFSPNLGLLYENLSPNKMNEKKVDSTGGNDLLGVVGIENRFDKVIIGLNVQLPLMNNISDNQTTIKMRAMAHITYVF
jgi:hypothetical protein